MSKNLVIRSNCSGMDIALLEDGKLIEFQQEQFGKEFSVGDIYIGRVKKLIAGLNSSFVNIGYNKDAFLHYNDLGAKVNTALKFLKDKGKGSYAQLKLQEDIIKEGKIEDVIQPGQNILVQIVKEPISTKGPRLTSQISLAGRYLILIPFSNKISVSQKIKSISKKNFLKKLVNSIKPKNFGVVIRTLAEDKTTEELENDLKELLSKWYDLVKKFRTKKIPSKLLSEIDKTSIILRDLFNDSFDRIIVNNTELFEDIQSYLHQIAPEKINILKLYKFEKPIFEKYNIEKQLKGAFGKTVSITRGAYLVIEHTEALHVIDVNSGNRIHKNKDQKNTALEINLLAAKEVSRQLKLRDMGGIIVIDFIDMKDSEQRRELFNFMVEQMKEDRAKHKILPLTKFGLMQITRQRVRPEMIVDTMETNPSGEGQVEAPILLIEKIFNILQQLPQNKINIHTHPFIAAYLTKGIFSLRLKWSIKLKKRIKITKRYSYQFLEYKFYKGKHEIIEY